MSAGRSRLGEPGAQQIFSVPLTCICTWAVTQRTVNSDNVIAVRTGGRPPGRRRPLPSDNALVTAETGCDGQRSHAYGWRLPLHDTSGGVATECTEPDNRGQA